MAIASFTRRIGLWLLPFSLQLVGTLLLSVSHAEAGVLICQSHSTDSSDRQRLHEAMQKVAPNGVPDEGIPDICRNRRSAHAWLSTWSRLATNGAVEWWDFSCRRGARAWECETPEHRQLVWVYVEIDGILRRLEVSFDDATGIERARAFAPRAMRIIQDPMSEPLTECESTPSPEDRRQWEKAQRENALTPKDTAVELTVSSDEKGAVDVSTDGGIGLGLRFTDGSGEASSNRVCWEEWLVVG